MKQYYEIVETPDGYDLLWDRGEYVASYRSVGAARAGAKVEARRRERAAVAKATAVTP